jgi:hypothetical protein
MLMILEYIGKKETNTQFQVHDKRNGLSKIVCYPTIIQPNIPPAPFQIYYKKKLRKNRKKKFKEKFPGLVLKKV